MYTSMLNVTDGTQLANEMEESIESDVRNHYSAPVVSNLLGKCSFLDPRLKQTFCFDDDSVQEILLEVETLISRTSNTTDLDSESEPPPIETRKV